MAVQNPFFGRREAETLSHRPLSGAQQAPQAQQGGAAPAVASAPAPVNPKAGALPEPVGSKLTVGPNIKLKGVEITDCDTLVVEGTVEATMDSRVIQIAEQGAFRGAAEIDIAEIRGEFSGSLTARHKLIIHGTGKVSGKVRYGKLVIEEGGELSGEVEMGQGSAPQRGRSAEKAALAA